MQHALKDNADNLLKHGIFYPNLGIPKNHAGQHNLAWQMARYHRFDPLLGDWNVVLSAIQNFEGSVVLSSEDFEAVLLKPNCWKEIVSKITKMGFQVVLVIYLREPSTYLESIYLEHLKIGNAGEFLSTYNQVCDFKKLSYDERDFCFNYPNIEKAMSAIPEIKLVFRNYHHLVNGSIISDFEDLLHIRGVLSRNKVSTQKKNVRNPIEKSLKLFVRNRAWSWFEPTSAQKIYRVIDLLITHDKFKLVISAHMQDILNNRLSESHNFLKGIHDAGAENQGVDDEKNVFGSKVSDEMTSLDVARVFSFETYILLVKLSRAMSDSDEQNELSQLSQSMQSELARWWRWVKLSEDNNS